MINFNTIPKDLKWFAKRYNALIVEFPQKITPQILHEDSICSKYNSAEVFEALKSAYEFLASIAIELLSMSENEEDRKTLVEKVYLKFDLIWGLCFYSEVTKVGNEYVLPFEKKPMIDDKRRTLPKNYNRAFNVIMENGCFVEYFKADQEVKDFKYCDNGILHFDNNLTALGIYLFIKKCAQKKWYCSEDKAGNYALKDHYEPIIRCVEPYRRIDMRLFLSDERLKFCPTEIMAGYNDELKKCFFKICDHIEKNYSDCIPSDHFSTTFGVDSKHRMIGQIGIGHDEKHLSCYAAMTGIEMETLLTNIDLFDEKVVMQFLHEYECDCDLCINKIGLLFYKGKKYNRIYKNTENRFSIENENDADLAIKCIDIKAKCDMNTRT